MRPGLSFESNQGSTPVAVVQVGGYLYSSAGRGTGDIHAEGPSAPDATGATRHCALWDGRERGGGCATTTAGLAAGALT